MKGFHLGSWQQVLLLSPELWVWSCGALHLCLKPGARSCRLCQCLQRLFCWPWGGPWSAPVCQINESWCPTLSLLGNFVQQPHLAAVTLPYISFFIQVLADFDPFDVLWGGGRFWCALEWFWGLFKLIYSNYFAWDTHPGRLLKSSKQKKGRLWSKSHWWFIACCGWLQGLSTVHYSVCTGKESDLSHIVLICHLA